MLNIEFNHFNHSCLINNTRVELDRDLFHLLKLLHEANFKPVTFDDLKTEIWSDEQPDYSLRQLARELQKRLVNENIDIITIVLVEDIGYALRKKTSSRIFFLAAFVSMAVIMYMLINVISPLIRSTSMVNNRVVFISESSDVVDNDIVYQQAASHFRYLLEQSDVLLPINNRVSNTLARNLIGKYNNAGLVIEWYQFTNNGQDSIRMELLEPQANVMVSSIEFAKEDFAALDLILVQKITNIENLLISELLPVTENAIQDPYDPLWDKIRAVLNQNNDGSNKD